VFVFVLAFVDQILTPSTNSVTVVAVALSWIKCGNPSLTGALLGPTHVCVHAIRRDHDAPVAPMAQPTPEAEELSRTSGPSVPTYQNSIVASVVKEKPEVPVVNS
jgi:hypothetical protein